MSCILWAGAKNPKGYGKIRGRSAAAVKWEEAHGACIVPGYQAAHQCNNPSCVNVDHIRIESQAENEAYKRISGRPLRTEKVNPAQVQEIKTLHATGVPQAELGRRFGISKSQVSRIVAGWR